VIADGFDTVDEFDAFDRLWQLVLPIKLAPSILSSRDRLEHHDLSGLVAEAAFAAYGSVADRGKRAFDRVAGTDVLAVFGREFVEGEQRITIRGQAIGGLVVFDLVLGKENGRRPSQNRRAPRSSRFP